MGGGPPCFKPGFTCPALLWCHLVFYAFRLRGFHPLRLTFPESFDYACHTFVVVLNPTPRCGLGSFPFARRYLGNRCFFLFLGLLRCFSSPRYLLWSYVFTSGYLHITADTFPHSEICGSKDICSSPQLIAAYHVLLRLLMPRHSSYALPSLTFQLNDLSFSCFKLCE